MVQLSIGLAAILHTGHRQSRSAIPALGRVLRPGLSRVERIRPSNAFEKMIQVKARPKISLNDGGMWNPIANAPFGRNLELAVFDDDGLHALVFPCTRAREGWKNATTGARVDIRPTHWRDWEEEKAQARFGEPLEGSP